LQKECVHAFGGPNVDRCSHRIDKIPQQTNFWFAKTHSLPRSPFQQHAVRSGKRQGPPQHAIDLEDSPVHVCEMIGLTANFKAIPELRA
jgi:hypothetical protein